MAQMSPEDMAMMKEQAGAKEGPGVVETAQGVGEGLTKLADAMSKSGAVSDEDKAKMSQIMQLYGELVESNLSQAPEVEQEPDIVSAQGGAQGVPMGPNVRS